MLYKLLLLFCLYLPFQIALNPAEGIDLASGRVFIILLFLIWLVDGLKNKRLFVPFKIQTLLVLPFLFLSAFSLFWADNLDWGVRKLLFLLSVFPIYFVTAGLRPAVIPNPAIQRDKLREESKELKLDPSTSPPAGGSAQDDITIVKFLVWGAGMAAVIGIIQFLLQFIIGLDQTVGIWRNYMTPLFLGKAFSQAVLEYPSWLVNIDGKNFLRAFSTFPDPHMFSFYLGLTLPLAFGLYFSLRKKIYLALSIVILLANLLTFSRGGYFGLAAGFIFTALYFVISKKRNLKKLAIFLVLILILLISIIVSPIGKRAITSFSLEEGSNKERFANWQQATGVIIDNPLGVGIGNYAYEIEPSAFYRKPIYAHNLYLDIAAETGIINAAIFILLIIFSIRSFIIKSKGSILCLGGATSLVIFSVHSIFDTALYSVQVLPLILIVIALSIAKDNNITYASDRMLV